MRRPPGARGADEATLDPTLDLTTILALLRARRGDDAVIALAALPAPTRDRPEAGACLAYAEALKGRIGEATAAARGVLAAPDAPLLALDLAGNALTLCHRPREAHEAFRRATALAPNDPAILASLAATARFIGDMARAEVAYDNVISLRPDAWEAYRARSDLRRQTADRNHVDELRTLLTTRLLPPDGEIRLSYALGKEYEDLGDHARAFACFDRGARTRRRHMRYDVRADIASLAQIAAAFDAGYCAPARVAPGDAGPIFIVGQPRTGSTLLERMLGRHSQVQALGELQTFGAEMVAALRRTGPPPPDKAAMIRASAALPPCPIGAAYLTAIGPLRDHRQMFIDKLPLNGLYAGLIARALPSARIVHMRRDPLDACLAIFKTLFDEAYPFSYDLGELGAYHNAHTRLMDHWRQVLGERFIEVSYEGLAGAPEATLKELLPRLGLAWESACLTPEQDDSPVMTASASQVREAAHTRSVRLSDRYRPHLGPLIAALSNVDG